MNIYYLKDELNPSLDCPGITYPFYEVTPELLENASPKECLVIAAKDETIRLANRLKLPVMGYVNPKIPGQSYVGVEMLVEGFEEVEDLFILRVFQRHHNLPWTICETKRCIVRELTLSDLPALFELYEAPGVTDYTEGLYAYEEEYEYQKAYIRHMYGYYGYGMWLVFHKETGRLIGRAGLEHREIEGEVHLEMGYVIHPMYQRQGYATEVCESIVEYAWENTSFSEICCLIEPGNVASIALIEKLGGKLAENPRIILKNQEYLVYNILSISGK